MKAHHHLIQYAIDQGCDFIIDNGWEETYTGDYDEAIDAIEAVDESAVTILNCYGVQVGWALVINDNSFTDEEHVADWTCTEFMDAWEVAYHKDTEV